MLTSETPTHPEYLAMMHCIDARRDDRLRVVDIEYKFNMEALERWAVARRAQILSQFYQSIRESREKVLEELGRQWYEIQHERRRYAANNIPDYGIRFPTAKAQQKRHAIAHSKEVSILSGIARHEGFPAAPEMRGATISEVDEDLEAITVSYTCAKLVDFVLILISSHRERAKARSNLAWLTPLLLMHMEGWHLAVVLELPERSFWNRPHGRIPTIPLIRYSVSIHSQNTRLAVLSKGRLAAGDTRTTRRPTSHQALIQRWRPPAS